MKLTTILLMTVSFGYGGTINFGTGVGGVEGNNLTGVNVATIPASVFHTPLGTSVWESTQVDSLEPAIPNGTEVNFWFSFIVPGMPLSGTLGVMVDDSARGSINGQFLYDNVATPQGPNCAASEPNCLVPLWIDISPFLVSGVNYFETTVSQDGGAQFALDVFGTVTYGDSVPPPNTDAPEPVSAVLIGMGLVVIGIRRKHEPTR